MNKKRYIILIIILSIIASTFIEFQKSQSNIFTILGACIALILSSYLFASLIRYGFKLSLWGLNFEDKSFLKIFFVIWSIFVFLNFIGASS
jgi:hypothetical protein